MLERDVLDIDEEVLGLDVAVDHVVLVAVLHRAAQLLTTTTPSAPALIPP